MAFFKRFFCKHSYRYFHTGETLGLTGNWFNQYHFVCAKCKKEKKLHELDIRGTAEKYQMILAKERAFGTDLSGFADLRFSLAPGKYYGGALAELMQTHYSKFENHIDK